MPVLSGIGYLSFRPQPVQISGTSLEFVAVEGIEPDLVRAIAEETARTYGVPCRVIEKPMPLPSSACDSRKNQFFADRILPLLKRKPMGEKVHRLAVTESDIGMKDMNFLFGLADPPGRVAVMSLYRLRFGTKKRPRLVFERGVKIAIHELGHTYGFEHCPNPRCVMAYSDTAIGVDEGGKRLCERCKARVR